MERTNTGTLGSAAPQWCESPFWDHSVGPRSPLALPLVLLPPEEASPSCWVHPTSLRLASSGSQLVQPREQGTGVSPAVTVRCPSLLTNCHLGPTSRSTRSFLLEHRNLQGLPSGYKRHAAFQYSHLSPAGMSLYSVLALSTILRL